MAHSARETLIHDFGLTHRLIHMQTEGLTHADSLLQPPFRGNCLNWVLGHLADNRNVVLKYLGAPLIWMGDEPNLYGRGSDPITCDGKALSLERLLADLDEAQNRLVSALESISSEALDTEIEVGKRKTPLVEHLAFLHWHETYHVGQLELLRQLAGKNDVVIP